jgi:hypothetical protein
VSNTRLTSVIILPFALPSSGVDAIWKGSVVADAYVVFTADAPAPVVDGAARGLQNGAAALYHSSGGCAGNMLLAAGWSFYVDNWRACRC